MLRTDRSVSSLPKHHYIMLGLVLALAATLRLVGIGSQGLWGDEGLTLAIAHWSIADMVLQPTDPTPPLYYILHKLLLSASDSAATVRGISFLCGLAAVALIYVLGRLAFGPRSGLLAAALLAAWPQHVDYSQEARAYALLFLLTLASATTLLWWQRQLSDTSHRSRSLALLLFALTTALSFYTHLVSVAWIMLAIFIFRALQEPTEPKRRDEAVLALGGMALFAIPGLFRLYKQLGSQSGFNWLPQASPAQFVATSAEVLVPLRTAPGGAVLSDSLTAWQIGFVAVALALFWLALRNEAANSRRVDRPVALITIAFFCLPLLVWLLGFLAVPVFMERTILFAIPGSILAIVALARSVPDRRIGMTFGGLTVLAMLGSTLAGGTMRPKEDWRGAYHELANRVAPGDVILLCAWQYPALRHAATQPVPAPVLYIAGGHPLLLEDRLGGRSDWDRLFFKYRVAPQVPLPGRELAVQSGNSFWLVQSECTPEGRKVLREQVLSDLHAEPVWSSPTLPARAGIDISRYRVQAARSLEVLAPPELVFGRTSP